MHKNTSKSSAELMTHRINRAIGQLEAIKRNITTPELDTCTEVVYQVKAVRNALKKISDMYVATHVSECIEKGATTKKEKEKLIKTLKTALSA